MVNAAPPQPGAGAPGNDRWKDRGVYVPEGLKRSEIVALADALMTIERGTVTPPPWDRSEACFLATQVLRAFRVRP